MTGTWLPPAGPATRGTLIVLPGRGEHSGVYERFGRRLASDAYAVRALDVVPGEEVQTVADLVGRLTADATGPIVLAGSDTGALYALALAASGLLAVDALLLSGIPDTASDANGASGAAGDWEWEVAARTTCPTHRTRIAEDAAFVRGALSAPAPPVLAAVLDGPALEKLDIPVLIVHGEGDPVSPLEPVRAIAGQLPRAELAVVRTAAHDVLNDATHRTVAAQIVQWLERLRADPGLRPLIHVASAPASALAPHPVAVG